MIEKQILNIYENSEIISKGIELLTIEEAKEQYDIAIELNYLSSNIIGIVQEIGEGSYSWSPVTMNSKTLIKKVYLPRSSRLLFYLRRIILLPVAFMLTYFFIIGNLNIYLYEGLMIAIALCFIPNKIKEAIVSITKKSTKKK